MDFEIDRIDDTYRITLFPPLVAQVEEHPGLSAEETERVLGARGQHSMDIAQQLRAADARHARGTSERHHAIVRAWHRAQAGEAPEQDVALLREELARSEGEESRTYLIQGLYLAGHQAEALTRLVEVLQDSPVRGNHEFALRFLPRWSP